MRAEMYSHKNLGISERRKGREIQASCTSQLAAHVGDMELDEGAG